MSLRDLVIFAQKPILTGDQPISVEGEYSGRVPAENQYDLPSIETERPRFPDWLQNPENEVVPVSGANSTIFSEGQFDQSITLGPIIGQVPDALAYYKPFHFYRDGTWGIYLRVKGILDLAAGLKGAAITNGDDDAVTAAQQVLFNHELFHCVVEAAATRAEVIARSEVYRPYFDDRIATANEEAMANAYTHSKIRRPYTPSSKRLSLG